MKKIYVLIVVCLSVVCTGMAQSYYWVGPANGSWNTAANWSATSGGAGGFGVPNAVGHDVIFNTSGTATLDIDVNLNTLTVTNNSTVRVTSSGGVGTNRTLLVNSTSSVTPGLRIDAGSRLEDSTLVGTSFEFIFTHNGQGKIDGEWYLTGNNIDNVSFVTLPLVSSETTQVNVNNNGAITVTTNAFLQDNTAATKGYLRFNAGSSLNLIGNGSVVPIATYNAASTVSITGIIDVGAIIDEKAHLGNVIYNCPLQSSPMNLGLLGGISIDGNFQIQNTNNKDLTLISNTGPASTPVTVGVLGNLVISGTSSVIVSQMNATDKIVNLTIGGNLIAGGSKFDMQTFNNNAVKPTNIFIKGNLQHTAGTFGASSTAVDQTQDLFVIEMAGTSPQTISSVTGTIDNAAHQVALRMNNAAGVTLSTPLKTGRINFNTANHGILNTTSTNILTIQNTSGNGIVVNGPSNSGYVNGPLRRASALAAAMIIPTGVGGLYREMIITPSSTAATVFETTLISGSNGGAVQPPLSGIANYYWTLSRFSGTADASVKLAINGAVPGAQSSDGLVVSKFDGTNWVTARGTTGSMVQPGTAVSGNVTSELQTSFIAYTIGYGIANSLPINLLSFTGKKTVSAAELEWVITENSTPVMFEVMHSSDGKNFTAAGTVNVLKDQLKYYFKDNGIANGNNYYRLTMFDKDGAVSFSNIIVVMNGSRGVLISSMIPTIVSTSARLNISSSVRGNLQLVITDISGRVVQNQLVVVNAGNQQVFVDAGRLTPGAFQITGYINGERTAAIRFIKQ